MQESAAGRTRGGRAVAALVMMGGLVGLLAGLWLLGGTLAGGGWGLLVAAVILVLSLAELAFAYGAWTRSAWAIEPAPRAAGFAVAVGLVVVGVAVALTIPVRTTSQPSGSPIEESQ